jgi:Putative phage holin Dp-1
MLLKDDVYRWLKHFSTVLLPALGSAYFALSTLWNLPATEQVLGTLAILETFLVAVLAASSRSYYNSDAPYDGTMNVLYDQELEKTTFSLELTVPPEELEKQKYISFKVNPQEKHGL